MDDERRNALTVAQMARLLDCSEEVVVNMVGLGHLTPQSMDPPTFSPEEAWRTKGNATGAGKPWRRSSGWAKDWNKE